MSDVKEKSTSKGVVKLTDKQKRFIEEYLIDLNATQAAIRAGYSKANADKIGSELLGKTRVKEALQEAQAERSSRVQITQDDVLRGLLEIISMSTGKQKVTETELSKVDGSIVPVDVEKVRFEPNAANKALELLGKHLGIFRDKVEVSADVTNKTVNLTNDEFRAIAQELLKKV